VPGSTINRLCGSSLDAVGSAARAIRAGEANLIVAGGVESMTRAPFVMSKGATPFARNIELFDTSLGWRFVNPKMKAKYGVDSMGQTAENVAEQYKVSRGDQDRFAVRSQQKAAKARTAGRFRSEITPVDIPQRKGDPKRFEQDEFLRPDTNVETLAKLRPAFRTDGAGSVTAGNSSGLNDGAAAATALMPEAHSRFTVSPGTVTGRPASSDAIRATLRLSSPAWLAQPMITSVTRDGSSFGLRLINSAMTCAARSSARTSLRPPVRLPTAVRTPSTIYALVIQDP
jgi:acetyl-CoA acetyltransferase family protein